MDSAKQLSILGSFIIATSILNIFTTNPANSNSIETVEECLAKGRLSYKKSGDQTKADIDSEVLYACGSGYVSSKDKNYSAIHSERIKALNQALKLKRSNSFLDTGDIIFKRGQQFASNKEYKKALTDMKKGLEMKKENYEYKCYIEGAKMASIYGIDRSCKDLINKINVPGVELSNLQSISWHIERIGYLKMKMKNFKGAIKEFNEGINLLNLSHSHEKFEKALRNNLKDTKTMAKSGYFMLYMNRSKSKQNLKDFKGALSDLQELKSLRVKYSSSEDSKYADIRINKAINKLVSDPNWKVKN
tara:strand:+ start:23 stop:934 length:912 start_codon:yes stop_codon:yes gene_type:complete